MSEPTRRRLLRSGLVAGAVASAGCSSILGGDGGGDGDGSGDGDGTGDGDGDGSPTTTTPRQLSDFEQTYDAEAFEVFEQVVPDGDGYLVAGGTGPDTQDYRPWMVATDGDGTERWSNTVEDRQVGQFYGLTTTAAGAVFVGGTGASPGAGDAWAVATDSGGERRWSRTYGSGLIRDATDTSEGPLLLGNTLSRTQIEAWLTGTDRAGDERWTQTYTGEGLGLLNALVPVDDGYLLAGATGSRESQELLAWAVRVGPEGGEQWSTTDDDPQSVYKGAIRTSDGGYLLAGQRQSGSTADGLAVKLDGAGERQWERTYAGSGSVTQLFSAAELPDGYVLAGGSGSQSTGFDSVLVKLDGAGERQWEQSPGGDWALISSVIAQGDSYVAAGGSGTEADLDGWLFRTSGQP